MQVAILGCGYVGLELGRQLAERGHRPVGVRRSEDGLTAVEEAGFEAVQADVTDPDSLGAVPDADALAFAASAGGRASKTRATSEERGSSGGRDAAAAREVYVEGLRTVVEHFGARDESPDRLVYTGSTGVYGDHGGDWVDEETPLELETAKSEVLAEAERIALEETSDHGIDGTVARFGGLYGPGRTRLDRYLEGPVTEGYLNVVHRDDAAGAVRFLLEEDLARGEVVLVVDDEPVSKWAFADWLADQCGREPPAKQTVAERLEDGDLSESARQRLRASKRCSNEKLQGLGYEFAYPTVREGYREAVESRRREIGSSHWREAR